MTAAQKIRALAKKRAAMHFNDELGIKYLEGLRKSTRKGQAKTKLLRMVLHTIETLEKKKDVIRIADFGCGEGEMLDIIQKVVDSPKLELWGFDYNKQLLESDRKDHPQINFVHADLLTNGLEDFQDFFDVIFSVNTLHEVYSFSSTHSLNTAKARSDIVEVISKMSSTLKKGGEFFLYDGVITDYETKDTLRIRFSSEETEKKFKKFMKEYTVAETFAKQLEPKTYRVSPDTFMYFISKLRFIGGVTWDLEKEEIYNYFNKQQFLNAMAVAGISVLSVDLLSPRQSAWSKKVSILTKYASYPYEHILLHGKKR